MTDTPALDKEYWNLRYKNGATEWDMGEVSPPLKAYIDQCSNKHHRVLIPGGGNSYEARYLWENGFKDITVVDISGVVINHLRKEHEQTGIRFVEADFFKHQGEYDIIIEQTFFCALEPALRQAYASHMHELLWEEGRFIGVLFNREFEKEGPPFGGNVKIYRRLFEPYFSFKTFAPCYNSHPARKGKELFFNFRKLEAPTLNKWLQK